MTTDQLAAIEARANAATGEAWIYKHTPITFKYDEFSIEKGTGGVLFRSTSYGNNKEDAEFIAHARQDIPALCAEVKRLREALESTRSVIDEMECRDDEDCDHCQVVHHIIKPALEGK